MQFAYVHARGLTGPFQADFGLTGKSGGRNGLQTRRRDWLARFLTNTVGPEFDALQSRIDLRERLLIMRKFRQDEIATEFLGGKIGYFATGAAGWFAGIR